MSLSTSRRAARWLAPGATLCGVLALAPAAMAASGAPRTDGSNFSCRASALRVTLANMTPPTIEPIVANGVDAPCRRDSAAIVTRTTAGPVTVDLADASTAQTPDDLSTAQAANGDSARANASVTNPVIDVPGLKVTATVLSAAASYTCQNGQAIPAANSTVADLTINGQAITLPPNNAPFSQDLGPLGTILANQTVQANGRITQRALEVRVPTDGSVIDVVIGEATADIKANPCAVPAAAAAKPQCSDGRDNDGDGKIDAQDPGCLSGPGGTYNPNDNDETDQAAAAKPQTASRPMKDNSRGTAKLTSNPASIARRGARGTCTRRSFAATVTGRRIKRAEFFLDGKKIRTVTSSPFTARISASSAGTHRVTARVTFAAASKTKARTLRFAFRRCATRVRFTG